MIIAGLKFETKTQYFDHAQRTVSERPAIDKAFRDGSLRTFAIAKDMDLRIHNLYLSRELYSPKEQRTLRPVELFTNSPIIAFKFRLNNPAPKREFQYAYKEFNSLQDLKKYLRKNKEIQEIKAPGTCCRCKGTGRVTWGYVAGRDVTIICPCQGETTEKQFENFWKTHIENFGENTILPFPRQSGGRGRK